MADLKHPHSEVPADLLERRRKIIRREVKLHWQTLSEQTLLDKSALRDACLSLLYEKYGYARKQVEGELDLILKSHDTHTVVTKAKRERPKKLVKDRHANNT